MLNSVIKNYDEFKELFVRKNADGTESRKNGILLAFHKSKAMRDFLKREYPYTKVAEITTVSGMYSELKKIILRENSWWAREHCSYPLNIMGSEYRSDKYQTDGRNGVCIDGDHSAYRYQNMERDGRVFKMKVGKIYRHIIDITDLKDVIPETVKLYLCEEFTREWEAYTDSIVPGDMVLHIDDDFKGIYSNEKCGRKYFHSCMQGDHMDNWNFYVDAVKAKAAYLTEGEDGPIVARCVLFTEVTREDTGEKIRVAERQYSRPDGSNENYPDELLQRMLIRKLIDGGHIDAYKKTGAGCGDARSFVDNAGNSMSNVGLHIECNLEDGDYLSYQDSFKWYDEENHIAYNHNCDYDGSGVLSSTCCRYSSPDREDDHDNQVWSDYHGEHIDEDDATWVESRNDYFYNDEVHYAYVWIGRRFYEEDCFEDDCMYIDGDYYYAGYDCEEPEEYGLFTCPECHEWLARGHGDSYYSDLLNAWYCCEDCAMEAEREYKVSNGWVYAEWDDDYFEDESVVTKWARDFDKEKKDFIYETITYDSVDWLVERGEVVHDEHSGMYYSKYALELASEKTA